MIEEEHNKKKTTNCHNNFHIKIKTNQTKEKAREREARRLLRVVRLGVVALY